MKTSSAPPTEVGQRPSAQSAQDEVPSCQHWIFGNITIEEQGGPVRYERAIFFTFKTLDEFRAALRFVEPLFQPSTGEKHE